tara:strand:- start:823 stop:1194 length:372 start_codon:yes stop_codon:yes gene_type:complete
MRNKKRRFAMMQQQRELDFNTAQEAMQSAASQSNTEETLVAPVEDNKNQASKIEKTTTAKATKDSPNPKTSKSAVKETKTTSRKTKVAKTQPKKTKLVHSQELAAPDFGKPKATKSAKKTKKA